MKSLQHKVDEHQAKQVGIEKREGELTKQERELDRREEALVGKGRQYDLRSAIVELGEVQKAIEEGRKELDQVLRQLGEKKGLLSRLVGRGPAAGR